MSPSLAATANLLAIGNTNTQIPSTGGMDAEGDAYAEALLGRSLTWSGVNFTLGGPNVNNAVSNVPIPLPAGNYSNLLLLATAINGDAPEQIFVVTYTDGTTTSITQSMSDWFTPQHYAGEAIVSAMPYRITATGTPDNRTFNLYGYNFAIDNTKTVKSITLPNNTNPNNPSVVVLAVALVPSGSVSTGALTATDSYTLTCTGPGGTASDTVKVTVDLPTPAPTVTLAANPSAVAAGGTSTLTWTTANSNSCTASGGWSGSEATSGTFVTSELAVTTAYTLSCSGAGGTTVATAAVTVGPAPSLTLTATPTVVISGESATLNWTSTNTTACTASGGWVGPEPVAGSQLTGAVTAGTTYSLICAGAGGTANGSATVTTSNTASFTVTPRNAALTLSQSQQFTAAVPAGGTAAWSVDGIAGGNTAVGTISAGGLYVPPSTAGTHTVIATNTANPTQTGAATVAVTDLTGVYTFHNDLPRTGQNLHEYALTPGTLASGGFGKRWSCQVDGDVYAQPLYVANLAIGGGTHNVIFVATQHDSVYAIDADNPNCTPTATPHYWQINTNMSTGETTIPASATTDPNDPTNTCLDIPTEYGITGSPVIDPATNTLYFVANSTKNGSYFQRLHAINIVTGAEQPNSPVTITASVQITAGPNAGGTLSFSPLWQNQRPGLALVNGNVVIGWASHCDNYTWNGWLMSYNETTLVQTAKFSSTPNGTLGGIWMSAGAPAIDSTGNLYVSTGNGTFDGGDSVAMNSDFSMSFLKMNPASLTVEDFYTPSNELVWSNNDLDISSGGVTVLPDGTGPAAHPNLLVGSDKQGHLWLLDRSDMGEFSTATNNTVQTLMVPNAPQCSPMSSGLCMYSTPGYYNGTVYLGSSSGRVYALPLTNGLFSADAEDTVTYSSASTETYNFPGPTPTISASPAGGGLVWVLDNSAYQDLNATPGVNAGPAILRAYDANYLGTTLYSSSTVPADVGGNAVKFTVPVVANGHVYVGGGHQLTVYGLSP